MTPQETEVMLASQAVRRLAETLVPMKLPFILLVGLPNPGSDCGGLIRASNGLSTDANRAYFLAAAVNYLDALESGEVSPNHRVDSN